ncbi:MltA domain-containing protein [Methylocella sp.]|uniref:MltA domain-containing protein n=1 Tax=Methylocella sp. TaxID=1978226 RepID=UPI0037831288
MAALRPGASRFDDPAGFDDPVGFDDLAGFFDDALGEAFEVFRATALAFRAGLTPLRAATSPSPTLVAAMDDAIAAKAADAKAFFSRAFEPRPARDGFFTGYYQPVVEASRERAPGFETPLLGAPLDADGAPWRGPLPERAAIEDGALSRLSRPVVWLRDAVEAFMIQVQGGALARLADGALMRLVYAGRNGRAYRSIGRLLIERGEIAEPDMSLSRLKGWIRAHGQAPDAPGGRLMRENPSYVFFRAEPCAGLDCGQIGGAGVELTPLRSLAVDRSLYAYGTLVWVDVDLPAAAGGRLRRLFVAQDVGSAIVGPGRGDIFFGSGEAAGEKAGATRRAGVFVALSPVGERSRAP